LDGRLYFSLDTRLYFYLYRITKERPQRYSYTIRLLFWLVPIILICGTRSFPHHSRRSAHTCPKKALPLKASMEQTVRTKHECGVTLPNASSSSNTGDRDFCSQACVC
jgi:hypothetical protein